MPLDTEFTPEELVEAAAVVDEAWVRIEQNRAEADYEARRMARQVGIELQRLMLEKDVSVKELAGRLEIKPWRLRRILLGEDMRYFSELAVLAHALDAHIEVRLVSRDAPAVADE